MASPQVTPPLPAGYTLDAPAGVPPLPAGYKLDATEAPAPEVGKMSAAPTGAKAWLQDLEADVTQGSASTLPGKILRKMGAPGLQSGVSKGVADYMGSPITGPIHAAQGIADTPEHPVAGPLKAIGGALETATIPGSFVAPEAAEGLSSGIPALAKKSMEMIPSAERAGKAFQDVKAAAKNVPVTLDNAQEGILKLMDWQKKTQLGPTINKFLNRVTNPNMGDITYGEARDFYQLLGKMSADEMSKIAPSIRYDLTQTVRGLKQDIGNAADMVGKGQQYFDAMKEFRNAKKLEDISDTTKAIIAEALKRSIPYGLGTGIGAYAAKKYFEK